MCIQGEKYTVGYTQCKMNMKTNQPEHLSKQRIRISKNGSQCVQTDDKGSISTGFFKDKIRPEDYVISSDGLQDWYEDGNK